MPNPKPKTRAGKTRTAKAAKPRRVTYMTTAEAARKLGVTPGAVRGLCRRGRIPGAILTNAVNAYRTTWLIPPGALDNFQRLPAGRKPKIRSKTVVIVGAGEI